MKEEELTGLNFWNPEKIGEELIGVVVKIDNDGKFGLTVNIKKSDGSEVMTPAHAWLQSILKRVAIGNTLKIVYEGEIPPKIRGHSPTQKYKVIRLSE